jgi:hypothetical protein
MRDNLNVSFLLLLATFILVLLMFLGVTPTN